MSPAPLPTAAFTDIPFEPNAETRPSGISQAEWRTRVELAASYRALALAGITDLTYNHLSARVPGQPDQFLIKSEHLFFNEVTASSLLRYDLAGTKLSGEGKVSRGGLVIHGGLMASRPDLAAVFHTHTPANMAVSVQKWGLLPLTQHSVRFFNRVGYYDFKGFEFHIDTRDAMRHAIGDKLILVLRNHGVLIGGRTIPEAFLKHHFFEASCRAQVAALSAGLDNLMLIDDDAAEAAASEHEALGYPDIHQRDWQATLRLLDDQAPSYRT
jgi:ribulose-5-phosphate 4-epimerase/fuculose-1-phosphate aldolase